MIKHLLAAFVVLLMTATPVSAFSLFSKKPVAAPQHYIHDDATFAANTRSYHETPFNERLFEFDIMLPKDWTAHSISDTLTTAHTQDIPLDIVKFKSPMMGTAQAVVTVQYLKLQHEITVENWLALYAQANGYVLQKDVTLDDSKKRASASYMSIIDLKNTYTYLTAQISGGYVILARFEIPLDLQDYLAFLQKKTIDSFRLIVPLDEAIESTKTFMMGEALNITYPASWVQHYPDTKNPANMSVQLHNEQKRFSYDPNSRNIEGLMRVKAVRRDPTTSLEDQMKDLKKYLNQTVGLSIEKMISTGPAAGAYNRFIFSRYEVYEIKSNKIISAATQELRLVVLGDREWYVIAFLLTPTKTGSLSSWARNTRSFDLLVKKMK